MHSYGFLVKYASIFERASADLPDWLQEYDDKMQKILKDPEYQERAQGIEERRREHFKKKEDERKTKQESKERDILEGKLPGRWATAQFKGPCKLCSEPIQPGEKMYVMKEGGGLHAVCCGRLKKMRKNELIRNKFASKR